MENTYWEQQDNLWYFYDDNWTVRYKIDFDGKSVIEQYNYMGKWEDGNSLSFISFPPNLEELKLCVQDDYKRKLREEEEWMNEAMEECYQEDLKRLEERDSWKKKLKGLINTKRLWKEMEEENDAWDIEGIVELELTDEQRSGYSTKHQCARIKDEKNYLYTDWNGDGVFVWQTVGYLGDDYSGYLLHPLKDGRYLKTSYSC